MGLLPFSFKIQKKGQPAIVGEARNTFYPLDFVKAFLSGGLEATELKYLNYYLTVPELQSVINYRAKVFAGMKVKARRVDSEKEIEKHPILDLLKQPNQLQSFQELAKQYLISKDIFGNAYIHPVFGTDKSKSKAIYNLPGLNAEIIPIKSERILFNLTDEDIIKEYRFYFQGSNIIYQPEEIIHFNDNQIFSKVKDQWLKGESRIRPLTQACENIITAYEARGIIQGNSPLGILSNRTNDGAGSPFMDPKEKENVQKDLKEYGLRKKKYQFIVTSANLNYVSMASNITGLKLFEEVETDQSAIADAYSFPVELFQNDVTYENKKEAKKQLYQDAIIPEAEEWLSGLSSGLGLMDAGIELYPDYSHVAVLQDDLEKKSKMWNWSITALDKAFQSGAMTIEEYRMNLEKIGLL